jgi:hypothetical protein
MIYLNNNVTIVFSGSKVSAVNSSLWNNLFQDYPKLGTGNDCFSLIMLLRQKLPEVIPCIIGRMNCSDPQFTYSHLEFKHGGARRSGK